MYLLKPAAQLQITVSIPILKMENSDSGNKMNGQSPTAVGLDLPSQMD
jgi:hypothetical protein